MKNTRIITGLDIGSSRVSAVAAEVGIGSDVFNVLAHASHASRGVQRGALVDLNEAISSVSKVLAKLAEKMGRRPENIYVTITGQDVRGERSSGMIPLSVRGREITNADMERCVNVASTIQLPFDREILHKITHSFSIDDQPAIRNPVGLYASRLSCAMYIITANVNHIQNIYKCINSAGYDVKEAVFTGMADGAVLLEEKEREEGAMILHMGSSLTEVSIFSKGVLDDMVVIPIGAEDIGTSFEESITFDSIVNKVRTEIEELAQRGGKVGNVVLAGGMAFADGIIETLEEKLPYPIRIGIAKEIRGDISSIDSIRLATAIGLVRYAYDKYKKKTLERKGVFQRLSNTVVDIFNNYF